MHPATRAEWRRWLAANHASKPRIEYDAVEKALFEAAGALADAGRAAVTEAKHRGTWDA